NLTLMGMTLSGNYVVTGNGVVDWTGGTIVGSLTVMSNAVLNLSGSSQKNLYAALTNANGGTINWSDTGNLTLYNNGGSPYNGSINNLAGGLFNIQNDQSLSLYFGNEYFNNAGTLRKSGGSATTSISLPFTNTGTVDGQTGTISFTGGGTIDGSFSAEAGAAITFNGSFTSGNAPLLTGPGAFQFTGGTLTLLNDVIPNLQLLGGTLVLGPAFQGGSITNLTLMGMTLSGNYVVTGNGVVNWTGGTIVGSLTVMSNAVLNLSGSSQKNLYAALTNANGGTINWSDTGNLTLYNNGGSPYNGSINNLAGGLFNIQNDQSLSLGSGSEYFNNAGTLRKSGGSATTSISLPFTNSGTVDGQTGTISFTGGGTIDGSFSA